MWFRERFNNVIDRSDLRAVAAGAGIPCVLPFDTSRPLNCTIFQSTWRLPIM